MGLTLSIVEVDDRFRLTLPKEVRENFKISRGQKLYIISAGASLIVKKIPLDPAKALDAIIGDFSFDRKARRKAEEWLLRQKRSSYSRIFCLDFENPIGFINTSWRFSKNTVDSRSAYPFFPPR